MHDEESDKERALTSEDTSSDERFGEQLVGLNLSLLHTDFRLSISSTQVHVEIFRYRQTIFVLVLL